MHLIRFLISYVMVTILGLMLLLFLALNHHVVQLDLIDGEHTVSLAWVMVGAAAVGFVIPLLLLVPGRIAAAVNSRRLERDLREVEEQFVRLEEGRAHLLEKHESLVDRYERLLLHYQYVETDLREAEAELDEARTQLAASKVSSVAHQTAAARVQGAGAALRVLPPPAPAPTASMLAAPAAPARPAEQSPAMLPAPRVAGETVGEVRTVQPVQPPPVQLHTAPSASQGVGAPAAALVAVEPGGHKHTAVGPGSSASLASASPALPIPEAPSEVTRPLDRSNIPHARQAPIAAKKPLNAASATRRPAERLAAGARHGLRRVGALAARLRKRITALRMRIQAQITAQLARLTRRNASGDAASRNEQSLTEISTSQHVD